MIYHQKKPESSLLESVEWLAVDSDTLTMAICHVEKGPRIHLDIIRPDRARPAVCSHPVPSDTGEGAIAILLDCRAHFKPLASCPASLSIINRQDIELPEYLLLGQIGEIPDGILHTTDPLFISRYQPGRPPQDPREPLLAFSSRTWLPPEGWEYWSTDARQEIERLLDDYLEAIQGSLSLRSRAGKRHQMAR